MPPEDRTTFATRYAAAWSGQNPVAFGEFYEATGSLIVNGSASSGRAAVVETARSYMAAFPDMVVRLDSLLEEPDATVFHWTWSGTNTGPGGTGRSVRIAGYERWTFGAHGLLMTSDGHFDSDEYQRQLTGASRVQVRDAEFPRDRDDVERLWLEYLTWGNNEMQARHGVHPHSPQVAVAQDLQSIAKFQPPSGRLVLACVDGHPCGIGCLRRIGEDMCEIKRMYVEPAFRRVGAGRAILEQLLSAADDAGYTRVRLDSPDFLVAAHALYRSCGFVDIAPYAESELPDAFTRYLVFMERDVRSGQDVN